MKKLHKLYSCAARSMCREGKLALPRGLDLSVVGSRP
jgi:hypothetical protein